MTNYVPLAIIFGFGAWTAFELLKKTEQDHYVPFYDVNIPLILGTMAGGGLLLTFVYSQLEE